MATGYGIGLLAVRGLIESLPSFETDTVIVDPAPMTKASTEAGCYPSAKTLDAAVASLVEYWSL